MALVKEFYANIVGVNGKTMCVRGKWISFNRERINENFNLNEQKDGSKENVDLLTDGKGKWKVTRKTPHESIAKALIKEAKVWFYFVSSVLLPSKHLIKVRKNESVLLYTLLKG